MKQDARQKTLANKSGTANNYGEQGGQGRQKKQAANRNRPESAYGFYSKTVINRSSLNGVIDAKVEGSSNYIKKR